MTYKLLKTLRVVEASSFVASPTAGLYLAQMGAEIIRIDQIGGGPDFNRWPRVAGGASLYWEGLNKSKKSIAIDLSHKQGRELAQRLITAPGEQAGLFLTNYPLNGFLSHERLCALRGDLVTVRIMGHADGGSALDYTVNCAIGLPQITGPASLGEQPVNHVLPAWDLLTGAYAAFAMLAAERFRRETGKGQEVRVPLMDMALASISNLGLIAEALHTGANRPRYGNEVYGAFGRDYLTADNKRLMVMAITPRQWTGLLEALHIAEAVAGIEMARRVSFAQDEGARFEHRDALVPIVEAAISERNSTELIPEFDRLGVCWGPYQTMLETARDPMHMRDNQMFAEVMNPSGLTYPIAGAPATLPSDERQPPCRAPFLGEHTEEILSTLLGLGAAEISRLHDTGTVASRQETPRAC
jgi:2-methylfumaryl-CoA isomerase